MADIDLDLEQELLAVAGRNRAGASSGKRGRGKSAPDSDEDGSEDLFGSDSDESRERTQGRAGARSGKGKRPAKKKGRQDDEDDDDDDDAGSDLYIDEEDREKLLAMNELQREMILAERAEERDKLRQRKALLKNAKDKDKEKRSSVGRLSSRQRKVAADKDSAKDSAIRQIQAARKRQQKQAKGRRRSGGSAGARDWSESDDEFGSSGDEGEDEEEFRPSDDVSEEADEQPAPSGQRRDDHVQPGARPAERREEDGDDAGDVDERHVAGAGAVPAARDIRRYEDDDYEDVEKEDASHDELRSIQVLRSQLEAWYDKPFFTGEGMTGVVVRMAYGLASAGQQYMLFVVHDVKEGGRPYNFGPRGTPCNKYLVLLDGVGNKHTMAMQNVSNSPFQQEELERYHRHCEKTGRKALSKLDIEDAKRKVEAAARYRWDAGKVREVLERKRAAGQLPVNVAAEKSRLRRLLEDASARGALDEVAMVEQQLRELEARAIMDRPGTQRAAAGMGNINKRNMEINFNIAFKNISNKPTGASERKGGADPFSRRATRPIIYWNTKSVEAEAAAVEKAVAASRDASKKSLEAAKLSSRQMKMDPADLIRQLDIGIDMNLLQQQTTSQMSKRLLGRHWQACLSANQPDLTGKGILSIEDWKQRAGFMDQAA